MAVELSGVEDWSFVGASLRDVVALARLIRPAGHTIGVGRRCVAGGVGVQCGGVSAIEPQDQVSEVRRAIRWGHVLVSHSDCDSDRGESVVVVIGVCCIDRHGDRRAVVSEYGIIDGGHRHGLWGVPIGSRESERGWACRCLCDIAAHNSEVDVAGWFLGKDDIKGAGVGLVNGERLGGHFNASTVDAKSPLVAEVALDGFDLVFAQGPVEDDRFSNTSGKSASPTMTANPGGR